MKRITITITEAQSERLSREAHRRRVSVSELVRESLEAADERAPIVPGFLGLADKPLAYDSSEIDAELDKTFGQT